jgi:NADH-quinone oxidoreductase subunit M
MSEYGGIAKVMPGYAALLLFAMLGSMGLPLLNGFVGEFTILRGAYEARLWWAALAVVGIVLGAAYLLRLYRYTMLGPITKPENERLQDLTWREWLLAAPLVVWSIWIGLRPNEHFALLEGPVAGILERVKP